MLAQKVSPFPRPAGGDQSGSSSAGHKLGFCWLYNEGQCKWGSSCKFKHECSGCGANHPYNRCFKKGKGGAKGTEAAKGEDASAAKRDASLVRVVQ
ncbi:hypothetical protein XELAEV_18003371mg [Xenopus laevis]|uniref:C3H1-type domain-containing protein n=1 Tax=Xenopus laevis TaxID=8355 RepID=A0A974GY61_XENLA|nr:hypothetical protein XELAEV_18003371mg [Xenopus laevis]